MTVYRDLPQEALTEINKALGIDEDLITKTYGYAGNGGSGVHFVGGGGGRGF